jgi:hypothetical protein
MNNDAHNGGSIFYAGREERKQLKISKALFVKERIYR